MTQEKLTQELPAHDQMTVHNLPQHQQELAVQLRSLIPFGSLRVIDTRASVTGMGDAENDEGIFSEANFNIGFSPVVRHMVDREVSGARIAPAILTAVGRRRTQMIGAAS